MHQKNILTAIILLTLAINSIACQKENSLIDPKILDHYEVAKKAYAKEDFITALAETSLILLEPALTVHIDMTGVEPENLKAFRTACIEGIQLWNNAFPGDLIFKLVDKPEQAVIKVTFADTLFEDGKPICGHVHWKRSLRWNSSSKEHVLKLQANIMIAEYESRNGNFHNPASIKHIMAHELGHILGLDDSTEVKDIMGPDLHGNPAQTFSARELDAVIQLRVACLKLRGDSFAKLNRWGDAEIAYKNALTIAPQDKAAKDALATANTKNCKSN